MGWSFILDFIFHWNVFPKEINASPINMTLELFLFSHLKLHCACHFIGFMTCQTLLSPIDILQYYYLTICSCNCTLILLPLSDNHLKKMVPYGLLTIIINVYLTKCSRRKKIDGDLS